MDYGQMIKNKLPLISELAEKAGKSTQIDTALYDKFEVKRGLRDLDGRGVLAGLTEISEIIAYSKEEDGSLLRKPGELYYRGIPIEDIVNGFVEEQRFGFEEVVYLLLFGKLPKPEEYKEFCSLLHSFCSLPPNFVRDIIMKKPSIDMMNVLARSVLTLYAYDDKSGRHLASQRAEAMLAACLAAAAHFGVRLSGIQALPRRRKPRHPPQ